MAGQRCACKSAETLAWDAFPSLVGNAFWRAASSQQLVAARTVATPTSGGACLGSDGCSAGCGAGELRIDEIDKGGGLFEFKADGRLLGRLHGGRLIWAR